MEVIKKSSLKTDEQQSLHIQNTPLLALNFNLYDWFFFFFFFAICLSLRVIGGLLKIPIVLNKGSEKGPLFFLKCRIFRRCIELFFHPILMQFFLVEFIETKILNVRHNMAVMFTTLTCIPVHQCYW
jgi:hypothetical protein